MDRGIWWRLAGMMALIYAVQGAFWPLLAVHLRDVGVDERWRGGIFATLALGALAMPLGAGQLVDRFLPAQRFLALAYGLGTGLLTALACGWVVRPPALFGFFVIYWLVIAPTYGMSSALAMRNLMHPREQFGGVRLWGTIGWMAVGWMVTGLLSWSGASAGQGGTYEAFGLAAVLSGVLSIYCLSLPNTPPLARGASAGSGPREALDLIRRPNVAVFLATAFGVCLTTPFIYQVMPPYFESRGLPRAWITSVMTLSQYPEIAALAALPWMFRRLHYKGTLALGIGAFVVRYASLALDPPLWLAIAGLPLQGVGVACFIVGGQVFFDGQAPRHRRASAQALLVVLSSGIGSLLGSLLAGEVLSHYPDDYPLVFLIPCLINLGLLASFLAAFRPGDTIASSALVERTGHHPAVPSAGNLTPEPVDG